MVRGQYIGTLLATLWKTTACNRFSMHPFFQEIKAYPGLHAICRTDLLQLPQPYTGIRPVKAILLGADPTNDGIKSDKGLKLLDYVFGINSPYEKHFFGPQLINLQSIGLEKDQLYIQNVCRNYFREQTSGNKHWEQVAEIWLPYLRVELKTLPREIPVLVTAEKIMKVLVPEAPKADTIYNLGCISPFYSKEITRKVFALYRHPRYLLTGNWKVYKEHLSKELGT